MLAWLLHQLDGGDLQTVNKNNFQCIFNKILAAQSSISDVLRMVEDIPIMSNSECDAVYGIVGAGVVCIDTAGGKGTCNGDSGGPLG